MSINVHYKKADSVAIGIRIGNANSSVSYKNESGEIIVIVNEEGERHIPSALSYLNGEEYHGLQAKAQLIRNSKNTIIHFKNLFGKKIECIDSYTSEISAEPSILNGEVVYTITFASEDKYEKQIITLNEVMISHLKYLKRCSMEYIGKDIMGAVFTVPTDFSSLQIECLKQCAKKAELNILQIIKEPIAEILAYSNNINYKIMADKIFLVADFGETRSDATVVVCRDGLYTILATETNYKLGGKLLDDCLIEHFSKEFQKKFNMNPRQDPKTMAKLRAECETTKKSLSSTTSCAISVECMFSGYDFYSNINRVRFEMLGRHVFNEMVVLVRNVLKKAQIEDLDVDEMILAGGSSNIPKIAEMFSFIFPEKTLIRAQSLQTSMLNPSDIECYGAAVQASLISSLDKEEIESLISPDVTLVPHLLNPIGVVIESDGKTTFIPVICPYTPIPLQKSIILDGPSQAGDFHIIVSQGIVRILSKNVEICKTQASSDSEDSFVQERLKIIEPSQKMAECTLKNVSSNAKIEVTIHINLELKTTITARLIHPAIGEIVKGEIAACQKTP